MSEVLIARAEAEMLKKHVAMIHVSGSPSFLQKKAANVMHHHAYDELADLSTVWHTITIAELAKKVRYDSHDRQTLHNALLGMVNICISWDLTGEGGNRIQGRLAYMSQVVIEHKSGVCRYAYPPAMRAWLYRPEVYAQINLAVQRAFSSKYAIALYENCVRYKDNNDNYLALQYKRASDSQVPAITGWKPLAWWKQVLGVAEDDYRQFKYFRRDVLKPAIKEVSTFSEIVLEMELRRENRRISELMFVIRPNRQPTLFKPEHFLPEDQEKDVVAPTTPLQKALPPPSPESVETYVPHHHTAGNAQRAAPHRYKVRQKKPQRPAREYTEAEQTLCKRMRTHGIASHKHDELLAFEKTDPGRITRNLAHLEAILKLEPDSITSPGAWAVEAIRVDYSATVEPEIIREIKANKETAREAAIRARQKAEADKRHAKRKREVALQEERRINDLGKALFESWTEERQRQFDAKVAAHLEGQVDEETGAPILSVSTYLRLLIIQQHRTSWLADMVREQEAESVTG